MALDSKHASVRFRQSLSDAEPPSGLSGPVVALWHEAKGDWDTAHHIVQTDDSRDAAWVHAYLHRKEGDHANADYWYHRAKRVFPSIGLDEEWQELVSALLPET